MTNDIWWIRLWCNCTKCPYLVDDASFIRITRLLSSILITLSAPESNSLLARGLRQIPTATLLFMLLSHCFYLGDGGKVRRWILKISNLLEDWLEWWRYWRIFLYTLIHSLQYLLKSTRSFQWVYNITIHLAIQCCIFVWFSADWWTENLEYSAAVD